MVELNLGWDALINAASGVLLIAFGAWVATLRPRTRATLLLAAFSIVFGAVFLPNNLLTVHDWFGVRDLPVQVVVEHMLKAAAVACLLLMALWLPRPLAKEERRRILEASLLAGGVLLLWAASFVTIYAPRIDGSLGSGMAHLLGHFEGQRQLVATSMTVALWVFPITLTLRHAGSARASGEARFRSQARLMAAAMALWPGVEAGSWLGVTLLAESAFKTLMAFPVLLAALWLRESARVPEREARACRNLALLCLAGPLVGMASNVFFWDHFTAAGPQHGVARALSVLLLGYAILRTRLLGIDLRVKGTVRRGTVATLLVGSALLVFEAGRLVVRGPEAAYLGIAAAGVLVFALARLDRLAGRVADAAMPRVQDSEAYLDARRVELYQAALEEALDAEGEVRAANAALLAKLRGELGISDRDHALLLHGLRASRRRTGPRGGADDLALAPGAMVLGRYRILEPLGEGAQGRTVLAEDVTLRRRVALKTWTPGARADAEALLREARALAAVQHPHVVAVHDAERVGDQVLVVMEHLGGGSLQARLRRGPLPEAAFRKVAGGLLRGLGAVHAAGLVHRDVKPSNVLLAPEGTAKLADFGVARQPGADTTLGGLRRGAPAVGTLRYMAPEQARGRGTSVRSDLFGAAATLFEAATGKPYLEARPGESAAELQMRAASTGPFLRHAEVPPALRAWFAQALHPEPARRFGSAAAMREALEEAAGAAGSASSPASAPVAATRRAPTPGPREREAESS